MHTFFVHISLLNWDTCLVSLANSMQINITNERCLFSAFLTMKGSVISRRNCDCDFCRSIRHSGHEILHYSGSGTANTAETPCRHQAKSENARVEYCHNCHWWVFGRFGRVSKAAKAISHHVDTYAMLCSFQPWNSRIALIRYCQNCRNTLPPSSKIWKVVEWSTAITDVGGRLAALVEAAKRTKPFHTCWYLRLALLVLSMKFPICADSVLPKLPKHFTAIKQNLKNGRVEYCRYCRPWALGSVDIAQQRAINIEVLDICGSCTAEKTLLIAAKINTCWVLLHMGLSVQEAACVPVFPLSLAAFFACPSRKSYPVVQPFNC